MQPQFDTNIYIHLSRILHHICRYARSKSCNGHFLYNFEYYVALGETTRFYASKLHILEN